MYAPLAIEVGAKGDCSSTTIDYCRVIVGGWLGVCEESLRAGIGRCEPCTSLGCRSFSGRRGGVRLAT